MIRQKEYFLNFELINEIFFVDLDIDYASLFQIIRQWFEFYLIWRIKYELFLENVLTVFLLFTNYFNFFVKEKFDPSLMDL